MEINIILFCQITVITVITYCQCTVFIQTICGTASLRWGLHLIGYLRTVILWAILIIVIIKLCLAFLRIQKDFSGNQTKVNLKANKLELSLLLNSLLRYSQPWASDFSISRYSWENTGRGTATFDRSDASMEVWRTSSKRVVPSWPA